MKRFPILTLVAAALAITACDSDSIHETTEKTTSGAIETGKAVAAGVKDGVQQGRRDEIGIDGALIVRNAEELNEHVIVTVLSHAAVDDDVASVDLAFENTTDQTVRLIDLEEKHALMLIDSQGFSHERSAPMPDEVSVPGNAKVRQTFHFSLPAGSTLDANAKVRVWTHDAAFPANAGD